MRKRRFGSISAFAKGRLGDVIEEGRKDEKEQIVMFGKAKTVLMNWAAENGIHVSEMLLVPMMTRPSEIYVFYKTDDDMIAYRDNRTTNEVKHIVVKELEDLGYFSSGRLVWFVFTSDDDVNRNAMGDYYLYLR